MNFQLISIIALVATFIIALIYGLFLLMNPTRTASDRLREMSDRDNEDVFEIGVEADGLNAIAGRIGTLASPQSEEERSKLRQVLMQAGYKQRHALEIFNGLKVTLALGLPLLMLPLATNFSALKGGAIVIIAAAAGYYIPGLYITNIVQKRQHTLLRSFPDVLDLLVSSVEAGLGLDAAFRRVATEMEASAPDLAKEFQMVNHEISAGVARVDSLKHLHERTGLEEVRSLVNMLAQSERFGTSVAKSLRIHATTTRQRRMSRAEEEAAKVSPKLTVVMILFLLPVLMSILVGPAMIRVKNTFGS